MCVVRKRQNVTYVNDVHRNNNASQKRNDTVGHAGDYTVLKLLRRQVCVVRKRQNVTYVNDVHRNNNASQKKKKANFLGYFIYSSLGQRKETRAREGKNFI